MSSPQSHAMSRTISPGKTHSDYTEPLHWSRERSQKAHRHVCLPIPLQWPLLPHSVAKTWGVVGSLLRWKGNSEPTCQLHLDLVVRYDWWELTQIIKFQRICHIDQQKPQQLVRPPTWTWRHDSVASRTDSMFSWHSWCAWVVLEGQSEKRLEQFSKLKQ